MPWLAVPLSEAGIKRSLSSLFEVEGIPTLVVLDENDKVHAMVLYGVRARVCACGAWGLGRCMLGVWHGVWLVLAVVVVVVVVCVCVCSA